YLNRIAGRWMEATVGLESRSRGKERRESAGTIERNQILISADMPVTDIDLRDRPAAGTLHHLDPTRRLEIDANLGNLRYAFGAQIALRPDAIRTHGGRIHQNRGAHDFCTGSPASFHALK